MRRFGTEGFNLPIRTPGPLGHNDTASPDSPDWVVGETPGPLGLHDHADPSLPVYKIKSKVEPFRPAWNEEVPVPQGINPGLSVPTPDLLTEVLGQPREDYSDECQAVTYVPLASQILASTVGPFKVRGLRAAVGSLKLIMAEVRREYPDLYLSLGTPGMLCCRRQRGSRKISSHSWGTAIDLKIMGELDERGDGKVQYGLTLIARFFNRHGWFWGATFRKEDAMHFEVSKEKLLQWEAQGEVQSQRRPRALDHSQE